MQRGCGVLCSLLPPLRSNHMKGNESIGLFLKMYLYSIPFRFCYSSVFVLSAFLVAHKPRCTKPFLYARLHTAPPRPCIRPQAFSIFQLCVCSSLTSYPLLFVFSGVSFCCSLFSSYVVSEYGFYFSLSFPPPLPSCSYKCKRLFFAITCALIE